MLDIFKQKPFPFSLFVLVGLAFLHWVGSAYSLYWLYSWFEVLVHIVSGLWIGSVILWLASVFGQVNSLKEYRIKSFLIAFVSTVLVGVVWELVENYYQLAFIKDPGYSFNTALDILNDALGGVLACIYFIRMKKITNQNKEDILHPFYNQTGLVRN